MFALNIRWLAYTSLSSRQSKWVTWKLQKEKWGGREEEESQAGGQEGEYQEGQEEGGDSCFLSAIRQVEGCYGEGHSSEVAGHTVSIFFKRTHKQMNWIEFALLPLHTFYMFLSFKHSCSYSQRNESWSDHIRFVNFVVNWHLGQQVFYQWRHHCPCTLRRCCHHSHWYRPTPTRQVRVQRFDGGIGVMRHKV